MSNYFRYGLETNLFDAYSSRPFAQTILYANSTEFGIVNADGSNTYFFGTGLVWDDQLGQFTAGTITSIKHYSNGEFTDSLYNFSMSVMDIQHGFETFDGDSDWLRSIFLSGNDVLDARNRVGDAVVPTKLIGYDGNDRIYGGDGDDRLWGLNGFDTVVGGAGNDFVNGGWDNDLLFGHSGDDIIIGDGEHDTMYGGTGDDYIHGAAGNDLYFGGAGIDTAVYTRSLYDLIITKTATGFSIIEPHGLDTLTGIERLATDEGVFVWDAATHGWKKISGTPGALFLYPSDGMRGTNSADMIDLRNHGKNIVQAFGGDDTVYGADDYDLLLGGTGNDYLRGDVNTPSLQTISNDRLHGEAGNDSLFGNGGDDMLYGGIGRDLLAGGNGDDTMTGGAEADVFRLRWATSGSFPETWGDDVVLDFTVGIDHLQLFFGPFSSAPGNLTPSLTQTSTGLLVWLDGAGSIFLKGINGSGLTPDDLLL